MGKRLPATEDWIRGALCLVWTTLVVAHAGVFAAPAHGHVGERHGGTRAEAPAAPAAQGAAERAGGDHHHAAVGSEAEASASTHAGSPEGVPRPLAWLGKFHPPLTHFPVALLITAAVAELLHGRRPRELFRHAVRFCVWAGAIGAVVAAPLGWFFAGFRLVDDEWVMTAHRWAGTATAFWAFGLLYPLERLENVEAGGARTGFRTALFIGAGLVGATGFLGGSLIYGLDHYAW